MPRRVSALAVAPCGNGHVVSPGTRRLLHRLHLHPRDPPARVPHAVIRSAVAVRTSDPPSSPQPLRRKTHLCPLAFLFGGQFGWHLKERVPSFRIAACNCSTCHRPQLLNTFLCW